MCNGSYHGDTQPFDVCGPIYVMQKFYEPVKHIFFCNMQDRWQLYPQIFMDQPEPLPYLVLESRL